MQHRHLLPDEIDLLLDEDGGFGLAPLRAHLEACTQCRRLVERARVVTDALDRLGREAPASAFADRVMARVDVFEPWHVAALTAARRVLPRSTAGRAAVGAGALMAAASLSAAGLAAALHADAVAYGAQLAIGRLRTLALTATQQAVSFVLGDGARLAGQSGISFPAAVFGLGLILTLSAAAFGLRALVVSRRR